MPRHTTDAHKVDTHRDQSNDVVHITTSGEPISMVKSGDCQPADLWMLPSANFQNTEQKACPHIAGDDQPASPPVRSSNLETATCTPDVLVDADADDIMTLELDSNILDQQITVHDSLSAHVTRWPPCLHALASALHFFAPADYPYLGNPPLKHLQAPIAYCLIGGLAVLSTQRFQVGYFGAGWLAAIGFGGVVTFWLRMHETTTRDHA